MNGTRNKLGIRLQMLHKSIVYELYEIRWQQVIIWQNFCYLHCESKTFTCMIHTNRQL